MGEEPRYRTGAEAVEAAIDRAASGGGSDTEWLKWAGGDVKLIRFLTDGHELITVKMHENVLCHDNKRRSFVCRKESGAECELCLVSEASKNKEARRRDLVWGIGIVRLEHKDEQGNVLGYKDEVVEVDGKRRPVVAVIRQAPSNFWAQPIAYYKRLGTICDRDYVIERKGDDLNTSYVCIPASDKLVIEDLKEKYGPFAPDITAILDVFGSQEYYDRHLRGADTGSEQAPAQPSQPVPDDDTEFQRIAQAREELAATARSGEYDG